MTKKKITPNVILLKSVSFRFSLLSDIIMTELEQFFNGVLCRVLADIIGV